MSTDEYLEISAQDNKQQILEDLQELREETIEANRTINPLDPFDSGFQQQMDEPKEVSKTVLN